MNAVAQQALRNCMEAYIVLKQDMCELHDGPFDCIMLMEAHFPQRIAVAPITARPEISTVAAMAKAQGAQFVVIACEAHVKESTLAEALAAHAGDVTKAARDGDLSVIDWIVVQGFDADGLPFVPLLTVDVGYDDEGRPVFGEIVERNRSLMPSGIEMLVREAMR